MGGLAVANVTYYEHSFLIPFWQNVVDWNAPLIAVPLGTVSGSLSGFAFENVDGTYTVLLGTDIVLGESGPVSGTVTAVVRRTSLDAFGTSDALITGSFSATGVYDAYRGGGEEFFSSVFSGGDTVDILSPASLGALAQSPLIETYGGDDVVSGSIWADTIYAGWGNDEVHSDRGDDTIHGEAGNDTIYGGRGRDEIFGGDGHDWIEGGDGVDHIEGGWGRDFLFGDDGNDTIYGDGGFDHLYGGDGNDALLGGGGQDTLRGDDGDDTLVGGDGGDLMYGGSGDDTLWGDGGNDYFSDADGDDTFIGGAGDDTFRFSGFNGHKTITDFVAGAGSPDIIEFDFSLFPFGFDEVLDASAQVGNDLVIALPGGDSLTLENVLLGSLHEDDIII
jgi:Ca2+-binding RTX toxin-like protein